MVAPLLEVKKMRVTVTTVLSSFVFLALLALVSAFAAKKSGPKGGSAASTIKGFGKTPLTLAETLATFKSRAPESADGLPCPCGISGKVYGECCAPYHKGKAKPQSPLAVLLSRYSAFCWRKVGYVIESTHPRCRDYQDDKIAWARDLHSRGMFDSFDFVGLTVLGEEEIVENQGYVEFQVQLRANRRTNSLIEGQVTSIQERSLFMRDESAGSWSYVSGDVRSTVDGIDDIILNT